MLRTVLIEKRGKRTQHEIATQLGIGQKYLSKLELGQRNPSAEVMSKMTNLFKESPEVLFPDIFFGEDTPK